MVDCGFDGCGSARWAVYAGTSLLAAALASCGGGGDGGFDAGGDASPSELRISGPSGPMRCGERSEIRCAVDVGERLPVEVTGSTAEREDDYGGARCGLGGDAVPDVAIRWTPPEAGTFHISTEGSAFDTVLSVRMGSCAGREIACNDDVSEDVTQSALSMELPECQTVTVVVDGRGVEEVGAFRLTIEGTERSCSDGADNDGDGDTDCDDTDCFGVECPGEDGWPDGWSDLEWQVLEEVNARRAEEATCGEETFPPAPPLEMDRALRRAARLHSQDMTDQGYFSHDSLDGRTLSDRVADAGFAGSGPLGENILRGTSDPAEAVAGWMSSTGHCKNIMNPEFNVTGIGYANGDGGPRWTQDFAGSH